MKLEVRNLKKTYGTVQALKGINYTFTPGVYGILGANGAGKSTMINLITDNVSRDKMNGGSILFGEDSAEEDILKLGKHILMLTMVSTLRMQDYLIIVLIWLVIIYFL